MNKKTMKAVAATTVFAFGLSMVPMPAFAVSTNIVAETEGKNTLTLSQIQDLAVIYNDTVDSLELCIKQIENQEMMLRNDRRKVNNQIQSLGDTDLSSGNAALSGMEAQIKELEEALQTEAGQNDPALKASYTALLGQYNSTKSSLQSSAQQLDSTFDQLVDGREQLDDALDQLADGKEDLEDAIEDLEQIMRYSSAQLALGIVQLTDSVELMNKQIAMLDKAIAIYELQEKLGMTTTINVDAQRTSKVEAENQLRELEEQLDNMKRSLNQLIGRPVDNELNVVPLELSGVIEPAPAFTQELISEFVKVNPDLLALQEEREDLKDSVTSDMGSDEKQDIEYNIQAKDMEIKNQRQAAEDELKAMIATMNKNAVNYRVSKEKLATEQKNFAIAQKKYELGMISQLQFMQSELTLAQAELTNLQNGYQHYFDWQQYKLAQQGIDV